jgi:hypothetical protein
MASNKGRPEKLDNGRYKVDGLSQKQFVKLFELIRKEQNQRRKDAYRTLTPAMLRRKSPADLAKLGKKEDGTPFTREDLLNLEKSKKAFQKRYNSKSAGITYLQIIAGSTDIDIKRANNQVSDGSGIRYANISIIQSNVTTFRVKASAKNGYEYHAVKLRFEEWDDALMQAAPDKGYGKAVKAALKGRISIQCDCGRHQYWYRYLSTIGNYCLAPPKEFAPPKIRNPNFSGVACKHVLHVLNKCQHAAFQRQFEKAMSQQASKVGYGDGRKIVISEDDAKKMLYTTRKPLDQSQAMAEFEKYERRQNALAAKLGKNDPALARARKQTLKARTKIKELQKNVEAAEARAKAADESASKARQQNRDQAKIIYSLFKDMHKGKSEAEILALAAQRVGMSVEQFNEITS